MKNREVRCPYCAMRYIRDWWKVGAEKLLNFPNCPSTYCRVFRRG